MIKKNLIIAGIVVCAGATIAAWMLLVQTRQQPAAFQEVVALSGPIHETVSTTGVVEPRNRLKIRSSIAGRIEEILVDEGDLVRKGDPLALLSSTERAALLDAARLRDDEEQEYWEQVYRKTAVLAPIEGQVIVRSIEPGQTVTTNDSLFVLSDRLIVTAYVDETDIGRISTGQQGDIGLDAYPDVVVQGQVEHIHYESHLQNNVNIYYVDIIPETVPEMFRSGMSATIDIVAEEKELAVLLPPEAVRTIDGKSVVLQRISARNGSPRDVYREVTTGLRNEEYLEITKGISAGDTVLVDNGSFLLPSERRGRNPFMPSRRR
ncbi:MAG: HlyD family efflux transporter periplasmic adaptor subunit [Prosthecochloris sp.]|nr:HlyD family efflux transporter periplasmic adaptor subunit [Prosthecochloris sp.]